MKITYVKGQFVPTENASISVQERGFRLGDGVFESISVVNGKIRYLRRHLKRLERSLQTLRIDAPAENLEQLCQQMVEKNGTSDGVIRLSVSRGIGSSGYVPLVKTPPTVVAEMTPLPAPMDRPLTLWLANWRKPSRKSLPVEAKLLNGLNSTLAVMEARDNNCDEALILNAQDAICEASNANIFWRMDGLIYTPADDCGLVQGIAREILLEKLQVQKASFALENLKKAQSVILCNSIRGAMPVFQLNPQGWQWVDDSLYHQANEILNHAT